MNGNESTLRAAQALQAAAAEQGFDWPELAPLWDKLDEEIAELRAEIGRPDRLREELGDVLFMIVNLARHLGVDAEAALAQANEKFRRRYAQVIADAASLPPVGDPARLDAMEARWQTAKRAEREAGPGTGTDEGERR